METRCVGCGAELPEGYGHVCKPCMDKASTFQPRVKRVEFHEDGPKGCMALVIGLIGVFLFSVVVVVIGAILAIAF